MPYSRYRLSTMIARSSILGSPTAIEVEASSFSVWNCVITFLQILLVSTILYGAGWSEPQQEAYYSRFHQFRAIAFLFSVWALQSIALALLLVWALGKRSYHLCHSWFLCEVLMQIFIILCACYFAYHSLLGEIGGIDTSGSTSSEQDDIRITSNPHFPGSFRPPRHLVFLILLHFLIKGFGFWIVMRYMNLLKSPPSEENHDAEIAVDSNNLTEVETRPARTNTRMSPPPAYDGLCNDDLPCYDEALKLRLKEGGEGEATYNDGGIDINVTVTMTSKNSDTPTV